MAYEGPEIYRAPYASDKAFSNFERTVEDGFRPADISGFTDRDFDTDTVRMWGTTVKKSWKKMESGDFVIFYRDGRYDHAAEVLGTEENEALAKEIWPNYGDGEPWRCIIYLDEPVDLGVESAPLHEMAGYSVSHTQNFAPLNEMGLGAIRGKYGSVEDFIYGGGEQESQQTLTETARVDEQPSPDIHTIPEPSIPPNVLSDLHFPGDTEQEILDQINSALAAGKHIVFTGPPGTGKTEIARRVSSYLVEENPDVYTGHQTTTATADWSTFETVGGYMPTEGSDDGLSFTAGQVLRCFRRDGRQRNDLLVIDEINRSDIDKSFGQLFTLLSGQGVELPFTEDGAEIDVVPASEADGGGRANQYVMPASWHVFATMNSYDKTSLYEMSYAFMRRFAFVHVGAPDEDTTDDWPQLVRDYADTWEISTSADVVDAVADVWRVTNESGGERKIGPALIEDILRHVSSGPGTDLTDAVSSYVFPQLEGLRRREQVVSELASLDSVDRGRLSSRAEEMLQVTVDG